MCRPPPRLDNADAAFPLINWWISISPSIVGSLPIFLRIGVGMSAGTPSTLAVISAMMSCALVGVDGGFVPWDNLYNLLES